MIRFTALLLLVCSLGSILASTEGDGSKCDSNNDQYLNVLLLGGDRYSNSIELITSDTTCTPDMPYPPMIRFNAAGALLGEKIIYCGGHSESDDSDSTNQCFSYLFIEKMWEVEEQAGAELGQAQP